MIFNMKGKKENKIDVIMLCPEWIDEYDVYILQ